MALMQKGHHAPVYVIGSVLSKSSQGNGQIVISFKNDDGDTIDAYLSCTEAAWEWTEKKLRVLGFDVDANDLDIRPLNRGAESPLAGVETEIDVKEDTYNGKTTLKVDWIGPRLGQAQMPGSDEDAFAAELRRRLVARKGAPRAAAPKTSKPAAAGNPPW